MSNNIRSCHLKFDFWLFIKLLVLLRFFFFFFFFKAEWQVETEIEIFCLWVHFTVGCKGWDWARPKPETCYFIQVSSMNDGVLSSWAVFWCVTMYISGELDWNWRRRLELVLIWDVVVADSGLTCCAVMVGLTSLWVHFLLL